MLNKLSRKDINLLKQVSNSNASKEALNEYLEAHQKAYSAWNVYLGTMKANEACSVDTEELVDVKEHIIEYEGEKYKLVDRKARAGDVVIFQIEHGTSLEGTRDNKIYKVTRTVTYEDYEVSVYRDEYSREMSIYDWEKYGVEIKVHEKVAKQATSSNNQLRAEIIQRAKDFVSKNSNENHVTSEGKTKATIRFIGILVTDVLNFIVNDKKRTVVALIKGISTGALYARGIAKCHPDDVFNADIGKAIALGRALNKDVSEFESAVQPTASAKGMQIKMVDAYTGSVVIDYPTGALGANCEGYPKFSSGSYSSYYKIIDDTNAQYQETIQ